MDKPASWKRTLSHVDKFVFFVAMLLAIMWEEARVYWLGTLSVTSTPRRHPANWVGLGTTATLPRSWVLGALLVLFYRASAMLGPPQRWSQAAAQSNRRAFVRLWGWTVAVGVLQVGAVCVDRFTMGAY